MSTSWKDIKYFKPSEFDSLDAPGSGEANMDITFVHMVDQLRGRLKRPLKINSGYRTLAHNKVVGGKPGSAHVSGHAADIAIKSGNEAFDIVKAAIELGFTRIGIAKTFIHLDNHPSLPQSVIWLY